VEHPRPRIMPKGTPTFCVYESRGQYLLYRPSSSQVLATFDREREVIAAARATAAAIKADQVRVVFIVATQFDDTTGTA
jgi:hypothetical protein